MSKRKTRAEQRAEMIKQRDELNAKIKNSLLAEQEDEKKKIAKEHFATPARRERTHRLIEKGALSEKYFEHQEGSIEDFAELLDKLFSNENVVKLVALIKSEIVDSKVENNETKTDDNINNIIDIPKVENDNITDVNGTENISNPIDISAIVKGEIDMLTELNKHLQN